jgi:hypothetical protein
MIATDPLSLIFVFCFVLGFGFFLAASLMGSHGHGHLGHFHIHLPGVHHAPAAHGGGHVAPTSHAAHAPTAHGNTASTNNQQTAPQARFSLAGYINPTSIAIFLLGFGFFGYFFHNLTPAAASLSLLLALLGGMVLAAALLTLLSRVFANVEGSAEQDVVDRTGMLGKVSITIPEKGLGEIIYTSPAGMRKSIPARGLNNQHLDRDLEVVVVNYQHGVAEVDTWDHFMHGEINLPDPATPEELTQLHALLDHSGSMQLEMLMRQEQQTE